MKIAILMSTYNGEKYLTEQIKSILGQTNHDWHLYIRDDGSHDATQDIIRQFANSSNQVSFVNNKKVTNIGVVESFTSLLRNTQADFYMFSDQDDFWKPSKVQDTLNEMLKHDYKNIPVCVHTDLTVVDKELREIQAPTKQVWSSFERLLFWNCVTGCTMMINKKLKEKVQFDNLNYNYIYMHDWWLALVASSLGEVVYLDKKTMLYRQHGNNVEGSLKENTLKTVFHRVTHYEYDRRNMVKVIQMAAEFYKEYGQNLSGKNKLYVKEYGNLITESSFLHNFRIACKLPPQERTKKGMLFFAFLMIVFNRDFNKC